MISEESKDKMIKWRWVFTKPPKQDARNFIRQHIPLTTEYRGKIWRMKFKRKDKKWETYFVDDDDCWQTSGEMKSSNVLYRIDVKLSSQASSGDRQEFARERKRANLQNWVSPGIFEYVDMRNKVVDKAQGGALCTLFFLHFLFRYTIASSKCEI